MRRAGRYIQVVEDFADRIMDRIAEMGIPGIPALQKQLNLPKRCSPSFLSNLITRSRMYHGQHKIKINEEALIAIETWYGEPLRIEAEIEFDKKLEQRKITPHIEIENSGLGAPVQQTKVFLVINEELTLTLGEFPCSDEGAFITARNYAQRITKALASVNNELEIDNLTKH